MDRISELPECIVHHILSCFDNWDTPQGKVQMSHIIRMSVLSKKSFDLIASFPILDFRIHSFNISRQSFFKYVEYTTSRFFHQNVIAQKLDLVTTVRGAAELDVVNRCLELVLKKGVKVLVVDISNLLDGPECDDYYRLPKIGLSASVLESLTICRCELPSSLMVDAVKFKSLIYLELYKVPIADKVIKSLTTSCPLLQVLKICRCRGLKRFGIYGHQNLKIVHIFIETPLETIDIEAPNLHYLTVVDMDEREAPQMGP